MLELCRAITAAVLLLSMAGMAQAEELRFQGVWSSGTGSNLVTGPLSRADFAARGVEMTGKGLRLIDVETNEVNGHRTYTGLWVAGTGSSIFDGPMGPVELREARKRRMAQGLRMVDFEIFRVANGGRRYIVVWRPGTGDELLTGPMEQDAFLARGKALVSRGMRLDDVEVEVVDSRLLYSGLFHSGTGSNLLTPPQAPGTFLKTRDAMHAKGLELRDFERVIIGGQVRYVGLWVGGHGESELSQPRDFEHFVAFGEQETAHGLRTRDIETYVVPSPQIKPPGGGTVPPGGGGGGGRGGTVAGLPSLPPWLNITHHEFRVVVDFTTMIDNHPRMSLPYELLPNYLPLDANGDYVIPNNFCGLRIKHPDEVIWETGQGQLETNFPYLHITSWDTGDLQTWYQAGIELTGPIGACAEENKPWQFKYPITSNSTGGPPPARRLTIQVAGSALEFLNSNIHPEAPLDAKELFSDDVFEVMKKAAEAFEKDMEIDNGYCSIDAYVKEVCAEDPHACPVSADFSSPC